MKTLSFYKNKQLSLFVILAFFILSIFSFYGCTEITEPTTKDIRRTELSKTQTDNYETIKVVLPSMLWN